VIATEKSADGIVGGTSFAEGLNAGKTFGCGILEPAMRLKSRSLAFGRRERVKPGRRRSKGPKLTRRSPLSEPLARTQNKPSALKPAKPPYTDPYVRWCGRGESRDSPYPDRSLGAATRSFPRGAQTFLDAQGVIAGEWDPSAEHTRHRVGRNDQSPGCSTGLPKIPTLNAPLRLFRSRPDFL